MAKSAIASPSWPTKNCKNSSISSRGAKPPRKPRNCWIRNNRRSFQSERKPLGDTFAALQWPALRHGLRHEIQAFHRSAGGCLIGVVLFSVIGYLPWREGKKVVRFNL